MLRSILHRRCVVPSAFIGLLLVDHQAVAQQFNSAPDPIYGANTGSGFWYYSVGPDPYAGNLFGSSAVIRAQGEYMKNVQQAYFMREVVRSAKLDNRRKAQEQWLWERENLPTVEEQRQWHNSQQLLRARHDPPPTEIWSGKALNDLLADVFKIRAPSGFETAAHPLDPEMLKKINVTSGKNGGNIGLFKEGKVRWPLLFRSKEFQSRRERIDRLLDRALEQGSQAKDIDADVLIEIIQTCKALENHLVTLAGQLKDKAQWTPAMYIAAKAFLADFNSAVQVLQLPDASAYITGKYAAQGRTIGALVKHMRDNGLTFAPVTSGNETAYNALYHALRAYDVEGGSPVERTKQ